MAHTGWGWLLLIVGLTLTSWGEVDVRPQRYIKMFEPLSEKMINHINELNTTWKAGHNKRFKTISDVRRVLGTLPDPNGGKLPRLCTMPGDPSTLPTSFDAREKWPHCPSIGEIRDQSFCGSCWAFGAVEAMSDRICIASNGKHKPLLSAENLVDCCDSCGMGCQGGFPPQAWKYWVKRGIVTGDLFGDKSGCQPYTFPPCEHHAVGPRPPCDQDAKTPMCRHKCQKGYNVTYDDDKWYGKSVYTLGGDTSGIMQEVLNNGPVEVDFEVYADFPNYKSGVYQHVSGALLGGHAVRLIGWGEEAGVPYWLIANSWNTDWGDQGYFKIRRGRNECGIESDVNAGLPRLPQE